MAYKCSTTTFGSTGVKTLTLGFQPIGFRVTIGSGFGASSNYIQYSVGWGDGTNQFNHTIYDDNTTQYQDTSSSKVISLFDDLGAGPVEVLQATFNSFTATQLKLTCNTANAAYQVFYEAWS